MTDEATTAYVLRQVRESGVRFVGLWFTDVVGRLKSVAIPGEQMESALSDGVAFYGGTMVSLVRNVETDLLLRPDPTTFTVLPVQEDGVKVGRMFCDLVATDGTACDHDPRSVLQRALARASAEGYTFYVGCEVEHYYFDANSKKPVTLDQGGYFDVTPSDRVTALRRHTVSTLEQLGIAVESTHHEVGPSQYEVKLKYTDALTMADSLMSYRMVTRQEAERAGLLASFMPKPLDGENGSGLHLTLSLEREGQDVLAASDTELGLSPLAQHFIGGLLAHAPGYTLVTNPSVNSYKRLVSGYEAPTRCTWARSNWGDLVRVPSAFSLTGGTAYIELRSPDPSCNPYLAFAAILEAGLEGVRQSQQPPPLRPPEISPADAGPELPRTLIDAVASARDDEILAQALGPRLVETLLEVAEVEWSQYHGHVSQWELERYLSVL